MAAEDGPADDQVSAGPLTQQMLEAASVFGDSFDMRCVAQLLHRSVAELLPSVHEALAAGLVVEKGMELAFRDDSIRRAKYAALPVAVRTTLHHEAATAMLAIGCAAEAAARVARGPGHADVVPVRPAFGWESLTGAELRVARLTAGGLTNGAIADQLSLSRHTVESHLRHIYRKLDIGSRVELTRVVVLHETPGER